MQAKQQRKTTAFARFTGTEAASAEPEKPKFACMAHGCPVTAAIASGNAYICRYHDGQPASTWAAITTRLRNRESILAIAERCASGNELPPDWARKATRHMQEAGRPDLAPGESPIVPGRHEADWPRLYAQRLLATIKREVIGETRAEQQEPRRQNEDTWLKAGKAAALEMTRNTPKTAQETTTGGW